MDHSTHQEDGNAADDEVDDPPDCIIEMDLPEQTPTRHESEVGNAQSVSEVAWPEVTVLAEIEWPAWPNRIDHVTPPFETPIAKGGKHKEKLVVKGGKGMKFKGKACRVEAGRSSTTQTPPTVYLGPNVHGLPKPIDVPQVNTVIGGCGDFISCIHQRW